MHQTIRELEKTANTIRQDILEISFKAGGPSHPGPALSCADLVTALYFRIMNVDPANPDWPERDRFILSKGHACPVQYSCMAELGYFPKEELMTIRHLNSRLQGSPSMAKTPGVDMTAGTLGNGLSAGQGMAMYLKHTHQGAFKVPQVYVIIGDGESDEGSIWEAAMDAPAKGVDNLTCIVDYNHHQSCGAVDDIRPYYDMAGMWKAAGWHVIEINGHSMQQIVDALEEARNYHGRPTCIIANTLKGKGISIMENDNSWHQRAPSEEQYLQAKKELEEAAKCL